MVAPDNWYDVISALQTSSAQTLLGVSLVICAGSQQEIMPAKCVHLSPLLGQTVCQLGVKIASSTETGPPPMM